MNRFAGSNTVHYRHLHIEKHDIRPMLLAKLDCFEAVACFSNYLEVFPFADELAQPFAI